MSSLVDIALAPARFVIGLPKLIEGIERLPDIADSLERVAGDLTRAVQPLQGVAQRLNRFGRGLGSPAS